MKKHFKDAPDFFFLECYDYTRRGAAYFDKGNEYLFKHFSFRFLFNYCAQDDLHCGS